MGFQVRSDKSHNAFSSSQEKRIISRFGELRGALEQMYDIMLPVPCFASGNEFIPSIKKFCGRLLEKGTTHLWRPAIRQLSTRDRIAVAGSLFLFRKVLPSPDPDLCQYAKRMSEPSPDPDVGFLLYCRRQISSMFPVGWDRRYADNVLMWSPSTSACSRSGRKEGGCRGMSSRGEWLDRYDAVEFALSAPSPRILTASRICSVDTGGKKRIISVPPPDMNLLKPFHVTFYDYLSRFSWLLRGQEKASRFADFTLRQGEVFVSGDYESATDNLNQKTQEFILREVMGRCVNVPQGIFDMAVSSLSCELEVRGGPRVIQARGQLMGNLISFPLLCIVNYLAFKYAIGRDVPVRVNGDDIVFRATPQESSRWMDQVGRSGLVLSKGKTMVDTRFFSLNSSWFVSHRKGVKHIPVLRSTAAGLGSKGDLDGVEGRFGSFCRGYSGKRREIAHSLFLRWNSGLLHASNRSVTRGLGLRVSFDSLVRTGMWFREAFYLSMEKERPLPPKKTDISWQVIVPGWFRTYGYQDRSVRELQKEYRGESTDLIWSTPPVMSSDVGKKYWEECQEGTFAFSRYLYERKQKARYWGRLAGLGTRALREFLTPRRSLFFRYGLPVRKSWFFSRDVGRYRRNIKFVAAANSRKVKEREYAPSPDVPYSDDQPSTLAEATYLQGECAYDARVCLL